MGITIVSKIIIGVELTETKLTTPVTKYNENTGEPYQTEQNVLRWLLPDGIEVNIDDIHNGVKKFNTRWLDITESKNGFYLSVDAQTAVEMEIKPLDTEKHEQMKRSFDDWLQKTYNSTARSNAMLYLYCN